MRATLAMAAAVGFLAASTTNAAAQDGSDVAAWYAMTFTPYGALPPLVTPRMVGTHPVGSQAARAVEVRYGRWAFDGDADDFNTVGIGGHAGDLGFVVGYGKCGGCDGVILGGVDFEWVLRTSNMGTAAAPSLFSIGLRPALGAGVFTGNADVYTLSGAVELPISVSVPAGTTAHVVPFLSPGFGVGFLSDGSGSDSGARASLGAGIGLVASNGLGVHLGWRRIFLVDGPSTLGIALSFGR